ncbi:MAG: hypothetical protein DCF21_06760 [Leptolyngbya sp.]|nr:MAG: hypothetical protein DCF21_06760 [Leptolyngbya sp.]
MILCLGCGAAPEAARHTLMPYSDQQVPKFIPNVYPNIWPSPFAAKALVTLRDECIRVTTEAELSQLFEDVSAYLSQT